MHLYERLSPRFRPKRELRPQGTGTGWGARIGWLGTAGFEGPRHVMSARGPKLSSSTHHASSFALVERGLSLLPGIDLDELEVSTRAPAAGVIGPDHEQRICAPSEDARGSALAAG